MNHLWVVESRDWCMKEWAPVVFVRGKYYGIFVTRKDARRSAQLMREELDEHNIFFRAAKYVRED